MGPTHGYGEVVGSFLFLFPFPFLYEDSGSGSLSGPLGSHSGLGGSHRSKQGSLHGHNRGSRGPYGVGSGCDHVHAHNPGCPALSYMDSVTVCHHLAYVATCHDPGYSRFSYRHRL